MKEGVSDETEASQRPGTMHVLALGVHRRHDRQVIVDVRGEPFVNLEHEAQME